VLLKQLVVQAVYLCSLTQSLATALNTICFPVHPHSPSFRSPADTQAPLVLVPDSALQLPPGCIPPPAAFFLVEQLLRASPTAATVTLAVQLLRGSVALVKAPGQQQQQQQQQRDVRSNPDGDMGSSTELQRLAYCSLASSVVQACLRDKQLGEGYAGEVLGLASTLLQAAADDSAAAKNSRMKSGADSAVRGWGLAARLAAATAAGAYAAHMESAGQQAASGGGVAPKPGNSSSQGLAGTTASTTTTSSSTSAAGPAAGCRVHGSPCLTDCSMCCSATHLLTTLLCLERGRVPPSPAPGPAVFAALAEAAQQRSTTLQELLQQLLLALAWRNPVPGVCGNVLCERLEGAAAVCGVGSCVGTLCGGCRAAWYCCKECQRAAWEAHRKVCRPGS
jgi:hypothetical protein